MFAVASSYTTHDLAILEKLQLESRVMRNAQLLSDLAKQQQLSHVMSHPEAAVRKAEASLPPVLSDILMHHNSKLTLSSDGSSPLFRFNQIRDGRTLLTHSVHSSTPSMAVVTAPKNGASTHDMTVGGIMGRNSQCESFPYKLYRLLMDVKAQGRTDVVSFMPSGDAFCIHQPRIFIKEIAPLYFSCSKLSSFKRQLQLYRFTRVTRTGETVHRGLFAYAHPCLMEGRPDLLRNIRRVPKQGKAKVIQFPVKTNTNTHVSDGTKEVEDDFPLESEDEDDIEV
jgi:hypothetical protein